MYTKAIKGNSQFKKKLIYRKLTLAHVPNKQFCTLVLQARE